jgi:hypothetical protein
MKVVNENGTWSLLQAIVFRDLKQETIFSLFLDYFKDNLVPRKLARGIEISVNYSNITKRCFNT